MACRNFGEVARPLIVPVNYDYDRAGQDN
jgi:hypothetical protein